ncbi:nodulation protein NfeD [Chloroflexota bacterium]
MRRAVRFAVLLLVLALGVAGPLVSADDGHVDVLTIKGTINPVLADYIKRGVDQAELDGARALIIQMDTPGGLDTAMRDIIQSVVGARLPVIIYVSPSGGRAASAGLYITLSGHIAAMAPNTAIGAATPVSLGEGGEQQMSDDLKNKVINDAAAYIRSIAEAHGRNAEWAEEAVFDGVSITEQEALTLNVVDIVADDMDDLLTKIDGQEITLLGGGTVTLVTEGVSVNYLEMDFIEGFLYAIADPNIAFLLLSVASLGIMVEIFNPGLIFPGVAGAISGILAFYSLGQLPVNIAGLLLIVLAFGLFVAEAFTPTFGLFTGGGAVALIVGGLILFQGGSPIFQVNVWLLVVVAVIVAGLFALIMNKAIQAHHRQATTGREELSGKKAVVTVALDPVGTVRYRGELWEARSSEGRIEKGEEVIINSMDGLTLNISRNRPADKQTK